MSENRRLIKSEKKNFIEKLKEMGISDVAPMSFAQKRIWFLNKLHNGDSSYNILHSLIGKGDIDYSILENSINTIISRHESLRTRFAEINGDLFQVIDAKRKVPISVIDYSVLPLNDAEKRRKEIHDNEANYKFDLSEDSLIRVKIIKLKEKKLNIIIVFHHIISDAWSFKNFIAELELTYRYLSKGEYFIMSENKWQYKNYTEWQNQLINDGYYRKQLTYWRERLNNAPELIALPYDGKRKVLQTYKGSYQEVLISREIINDLSNLGTSLNSSLFIILFSVFNLLLYRLTNQKDFTVGIPVSGRGKKETKELLGLFVNTLVIRTEVKSEQNFIEFLNKTRLEVLSSQENADVPFEHIVSEIRPNRDTSYNPLFQVMFTLNNVVSKTNLPGAILETEMVKNGSSKFDLSLILDQQEDGSIKGYFEYNSDLFHDSTISRWGAYYNNLIKSIIKNPTHNISKLDMLTKEEKEQFLIKWVEKETSIQDTTIHELFEKQVSINPFAIAVVCGKDYITYKELNIRSNQLANYLKRQGILSGTFIGICLERKIDMVVSILSVLKAGGTYIPIDSNFPKKRIDFIAEDTQMRYIITENSMHHHLDDLGIRLINLDLERLKIKKETIENLNIKISPCNPAYIIYTSGSTGLPKGVVVPHKNVIRLFDTTKKWFMFNKDDVWSLFHSFAFDFSVWEIFGAILHGGRLVIVSYEVSRSPKEFYKLICDEKVTILNQTPSAFQQFNNEDEKQHSRLNLRMIIFGGEPLNYQKLSSWIQRHGDNQPQLVNMYGITETTVHATYKRILQKDLQNITVSNIGVSLPDLEIYILNDSLEVVPCGTIGEIYVGGSGLAKEYLNRPELTNVRFIPHPFKNNEGKLYKTGDLARYLSDGNIEYIGRSDHQVKVRGFRIELGEINTVLSKISWVKNSYVLAKDDELSGKKLIAFFVTKDDYIPKSQDIRNELKKSLPSYMIPSNFIQVDTIPYTINGKIDQVKLERKLIGTQFQKKLGDENVPRDNIEFEMMKIWQDILGNINVNLNDNFFELGGHSLLLIQLQSKIKMKFGKEIPLAEMYQKQTIEELSTIIRKGIKFKDQENVISLEENVGSQSIFLIHPVGGYCFRYRYLSKILKENFNVFGIQVSSPYGDFDSLSDMAQHYINEIKKIQKKGPYFLLGYSLGGNIAVEMAIQLAARGEKMGGVILLDTFITPLDRKYEINETNLMIEYANDRFTLTYDQVENIKKMSYENIIKYILDIGKTQNYYRIDMNYKQLEQVLSIYIKHMTAWGKYEKPMKKYQGNVLFLKAKKELEVSTADWNKLIRLPLDVFEIDAYHHELVEQPYVNQVGKIINDYYAKKSGN